MTDIQKKMDKVVVTAKEATEACAATSARLFGLIITFSKLGEAFKSELKQAYLETVCKKLHVDKRGGRK